MTEHLKNGLYFLGAIIATPILGLLFFIIIDIAIWIANKLGDLLFGKGKK